MKHSFITNQAQPVASVPAAAHPGRWWHHVLALTVLTAGVVLFYWDYLQAAAFLWEDLLFWYYPVANYFVSAIAEGRFPFWVSELHNGMSFYSEVQTGVYYPLRWLLALFVVDGELPVVVYQRYHVLQVLLGGVFAYVYLYRQRLGLVGSLVGALVYSFSGFVSLHFLFPPLLQVQAWLPLQLLLVDRIVAQRRALDVVWLTLVIWLALLASFPQTLLYNSYLVVAYWLYRRWTNLPAATGRWKLLGKELALMAGVFTGAVWLAAIQVLPSFEHWQLSHRSDWQFQQIAQQSLPWFSVLRLFVPNFFGTISGSQDWEVLFWGYPDNEGTRFYGGGSWYYWEFGMYAGQLAVIAAGVALWRMRRGGPGPVRFYVVAGLLALWFMLGRYGGLFQVAYYLLPGISWFRGPARMGGVLDFALAVLAAFLVGGLDRGEQRRVGKVVLALLLVYMAGAILLLGPWPWRFPELGIPARADYATDQTLWAMGILAATGLALWWWGRWTQPLARAGCGVLLVVLTFGDFYRAYSRFHRGNEDPKVIHADKQNVIQTYYQFVAQNGPMRFTQREDEERSRQVLFFYNTPLFFSGLETPRGYMDFGPAYTEALGLVTNTAIRLDLQNVGLMLNQDSRKRRLDLLRRPSALPRLAFYNIITVYADDVALAADLDAGRLDYRTVLGVTEPPPGLVTGQHREPVPARLLFDRRSPEEYRIHYTTTVPGMIYIAESHYPGWEAVDQQGRQLPILRSFLAFKGVVVAEPGEGTITLRFRPRIFRIGTAMTAVGLLLVTALGIWCARRRCQVWP